MKYKYIILDFGGVLVTPTTGSWDITPKFLELLDIDKINMDKFNDAKSKFNHLLGEKLLTQEEEYDMFLRYYDGILSNIDYPDYNKNIAEQIAYDRTYKNSKYSICDNIHNELKKLKEKYTLLMLTDNWPCVVPYMKDYDLYDYFDKIYISSVYGSEKKDKVFFDYLIKDYNIKPGEALFIDDTEINLDVAKEKKLDVLIMDRYNKDIESKYKVIHDLIDI